MKIQIRNQLKFNKESLVILVVMLGFLHPRGFSEYNIIYKNIFNLWILFSMIISSFYLMKYYKRVQGDRCIFFMIVFYLVFIFETLINQGTIGEGLQKLFATPLLCIFCALMLKKCPKVFIHQVVKILTWIFFLNDIFLSPFIWNKIYPTNDEHINFLGHVQISAQLGVIGIFLGIIIWILYNEKREGLLLIILSLITMIFSRTMASLIILVFMIFMYIYTSIIKIRVKSFKGFEVLLIFFLFLLSGGIILVFLSMTGNGYKFFEIQLSGRLTIWNEVVKLIVQKPITGYGAYGVLIHVFWHDFIGSVGMNYAHNEVLQLMLDGGIVLVIFFIIMLVQYLKGIESINNRFIKKVMVITLLSFLLIMIIESVTEYYYFFIFISIFAYMRNVLNEIRIN